MDPSLIIRGATLLTLMTSVLFVTHHPAAVKTFLKTISSPVTHLLAPVPQPLSLPALDENPADLQSSSSATTTINNILLFLPSVTCRLATTISNIFLLLRDIILLLRGFFFLLRNYPRLLTRALYMYNEFTSFKRCTIAFDSTMPSPARVFLHVSLECSVSGLAALVAAIVVTLCATCIILFLVIRRHRSAAIQASQQLPSTTSTQKAPDIPGSTNAVQDDIVPDVDEEEPQNLNPKTSHEEPGSRRMKRIRNKDERLPSWI